MEVYPSFTQYAPTGRSEVGGAPVHAGGFFLRGRTFAALISRMGKKTTFICDCCLREADNNLGWARVHINGASGDKQLLPDDDRDLCEICWSPLQTLMKKVHDEARAKRNKA
jgi:hypothetical protein